MGFASLNPSYTLSALTAPQLLGGARQHLDHLGLGVVVVLEPLGGDLAQILQRRPHQLRQAVVLALVRAEAAAQARDLLAGGAEPFEHRIDEVAVLVEMGAAL